MAPNLTGSSAKPAAISQSISSANNRRPVGASEPGPFGGKPSVSPG
jgi:hypothetical protein